MLKIAIKSYQVIFSEELKYYELSCGFPFVLLYGGTKMQKQDYRKESLEKSTVTQRLVLRFVFKPIFSFPLLISCLSYFSVQALCN